MGDTGRKLGDRFGKHRRHGERKKKKRQGHIETSTAPIISANTRQSAVYLFTKATRKAAKN